MDYYKRLKDIREDNDLTQVDIAEILKTTRQQAKVAENGRINKFSILLFIRFKG